MQCMPWPGNYIAIYTCISLSLYIYICIPMYWAPLCLGCIPIYWCIPVHGGVSPYIGVPQYLGMHPHMLGCIPNILGYPSIRGCPGVSGLPCGPRFGDFRGPGFPGIACWRSPDYVLITLRTSRGNIGLKLCWGTCIRIPKCRGSHIMRLT